MKVTNYKVGRPSLPLLCEEGLRLSFLIKGVVDKQRGQQEDHANQHDP